MELSELELEPIAKVVNAMIKSLKDGNAALKREIQVLRDHHSVNGRIESVAIALEVAKLESKRLEFNQAVSALTTIT